MSEITDRYKTFTKADLAVALEAMKLELEKQDAAVTTLEAQVRELTDCVTTIKNESERGVTVAPAWLAEYCEHALAQAPAGEGKKP